MNTVRVACLVVLSIFFARLVSGATVNVLHYGAVGDGKKDDSRAFLEAWGVACNDARSPTFLIPGGKTYLLHKILLAGQCKSSVHVKVNGNLVAPNYVWTRKLEHWITLYHVENLTIDGSGQLDGRGPIWWDCKARKRCNEIPYGLGIAFCNSFSLSGLRFINPPGKHLTVYKSVGVEISGVTITSPADSPNTDGILIQDCQQVRVADSIIQTGDDCIAIRKGSSDVNITNIACGPGHGISIGSLGESNSEATVEQVHISNCSFYRTTTAARIKTWQGGSGFARGITFENINFSAVQAPIVIDQYYCGGGSNCQNHTSAVQVSDVRFVRATGTTSGDVAIRLACSQSVPCTGIHMEDVDIRPIRRRPTTSYCLNAHGVSMGVVKPEVPCLS